MDRSMKPYYVDALKHLALRGGLKDFVALSSRELGQPVAVSQQSASQRILELMNDGLIERDFASRKQRVKIVAKGLETLQREYADYLRIFELRDKIAITGRATSGLGEGAFYMRQKGYKEQFRKKLGFEPYEGTLNLKVSGSELPKLILLLGEKGIPIDGFEAAGRTFGGAKVFRAQVKGVGCAVILPIRTHHTDVLEVISKEFLRNRLGIADGDPVALDVEL